MRRHVSTKKDFDHFNLEMRPDIHADSNAIHARPSNILVAVRDYSRMTHLQSVLQKTNLRRHDIVVMTVRNITLVAQGNTIWRKVSCSQITSANCSRVLLRWLKRKARQWSCWSCLESTRSTRWFRPRRSSSPRDLLPDFPPEWTPKNSRVKSVKPGSDCPNPATLFRWKSSLPTGPPFS